MAQTAKNICDSIIEILTRFGYTDDSRLDPDWMYYKINQVRAQLIIAQYKETGVIDQNWLSNGGLLTFHRVNAADDVTVTCDCDISKASIPQTIPLINKDGSLDLGVYSLISSCGKTTYYPQRMALWRKYPEGHVNNLFGHYARINTTLYVDRIVEKLKFIGILLNPEEGYMINSAPVASGSIVLNTVYYVTGAQIYYAGITYQPGETFTGTSVMGALVTTYSGSGVVHLYSQITAFRDTDPYPCSGDMNRMIELEILTKEFNLEKQQIADVRNDSKDDATKSA